MKRWTEETFLSHIEARLAVDRDEALVIARAVLIALADVLPPIAAHHVIDVLPSSLSPHLSRARQRITKRGAFVDRVARIARTRVGSAWEDTLVVCDLVRDALGEEITVVVSSLPRELRVLFDDRPAAPALPRVAPPPRPSEAVPSGQTLSRGKPGPTNPIADAAVDVRGPAQHGSVADHEGRTARKISSAKPGSTETLSSGRPR